MVQSKQFDYPPKWESMPQIYEDASGFYQQDGLDDNNVKAMAMIATELTENAAKYGSFSAGQGIRVSLHADSSSLSVEVCCPVNKSNNINLQRLDRMIQWIRGYQDPFEAYVERLKIVSAQSLSSKESGLGLVRIAYEGQAVVDFYVDSNNLLWVSAQVERED